MSTQHPHEPHEAAANVDAAPTDGRGIIITSLSALDASALVDERALADLLRVSPRTIRRMVGRYELPPPVRLGGRATWQVGRVVAWIEARADRLARDAERDARRLRR